MDPDGLEAAVQDRAPVGTHVREARRDVGLSQASFAREVGVTKGYVSRIESGATRPSVEFLSRAADVLQTDLEDLMIRAGYLPEDVGEILVQHPDEAVAALREVFCSHRTGAPTLELPIETPIPPVTPDRADYELVHGDCLEWMRTREANSIHAIVTDPPYGFLEYTDEQKRKLREGRGGVWRIPPKLDGCARRPLPRFTVLTGEDRKRLTEFFTEWGAEARRILVPGGHLIIASNPLLSHYVYTALETAGLEKRGEIIRLVQTLRGGDRPKNAHEEFADVTVMPRSAWEPWGLFRKPCEGSVAENLRKWWTGGLRRLSPEQPFTDVIKSAPTRPAERSIADHPSLKPQAFMRQVVRASLPLGRGVVLDPFMGGGATIAAAVAVGYDAVGIELDDEYFSIAQAAIPRLAQIRT